MTLPRAEAAKAALDLWRRRDPKTGRPLFEFGAPSESGEGPNRDFETRILGDLYEHLDAEVRDRYALVQTPEFIERFILDQTLEPALMEWKLEEVNVLDPTCGSGRRCSLGSWTTRPEFST